MTPPDPASDTRRFRHACVVGLGVVGIPVAAKLAEAGIPTTGLDLDGPRTEAIAAGRYPFTSDEPGMADLLAKVHDAGTLTATTDPDRALAGADAIVVVVQTPFDDAVRAPRYDALQGALETVGARLEQGALVVVESTIAPGTMREIVQPTLEDASGLKAGLDFHLGHCPERVMPGRLLRNITDYDRVVGGFDHASTERMLALYGHYVKGRLVPTDMTTAEVVKTTENAYRDVEIAFANEVARICQHQGVDAWRVRNLVNEVEGRNMHMPGTGVGGHCIPKDGLLLAHGAGGTFDPELLHAARRVNDAMPAVTAQLAAEALSAHEPALGEPEDALEGRTVVVLGAAYLPGSDDTRHTPSLPLAEALEAKGATVRIVDPYVESLDGRAVSPALAPALEGADVVVLSTAHERFLRPDWADWSKRLARPVVVDGRGVWDPSAARAAGFTYRGIGR